MISELVRIGKQLNLPILFDYNELFSTINDSIKESALNWVRDSSSD